MENKILIITGGSKGIGLALANQYYNNGFKVYSLARTVVSSLPFTQLKVDLINDGVASAFSSILNEINLNNIEKITLINNAGRLGKIGNLETIDGNDISETVTLNITIPLQLSGLFIKHTKGLKCAKTIFNISSGAAINPYQGWSVYCSSKAAIDMLTRVTALENTDYKILAIRPGVVATNMQEQIRKTNKEDFIALDKFITLHKNNQLSKPIEVAQKIYKIDVKNLFNSGELIDLRDL